MCNFYLTRKLSKIATTYTIYSIFIDVWKRWFINKY